MEELQVSAMASETGITSMSKRRHNMHFSGKSRKHLGFISAERRAVLNEIFDFVVSLTKLFQNCSKNLFTSFDRI